MVSVEIDFSHLMQTFIADSALTDLALAQN